MAGNSDEERATTRQDNRPEGDRRPWEGYRRRGAQAPDYGSAGGQYTSRVGPDQNPYTEDEGAYAGARNRSYQGQGNYNQGIQDDWEREGRGGGGGYGQVGGSREQPRDQGGYSTASRGPEGGRYYGQGGHGEERDWGRDRGDFGQYGQSRFAQDPGAPPDAGQLAYGPGSQSYGQAVTNRRGADPGPHHGDPDYQEWRREQARKYDEDYESWRESQLKRHDDDYSRWRKERRDKFGGDFDKWRTEGQAQSASASSETPPPSGSEKKH